MNISRFWKARMRQLQHVESPNFIAFLLIILENKPPNMPREYTQCAPCIGQTKSKSTQFQKLEQKPLRLPLPIT